MLCHSKVDILKTIFYPPPPSSYVLLYSTQLLLLAEQAGLSRRICYCFHRDLSPVCLVTYTAPNTSPGERS